jgi:alpha-1,6-mannosyltransferase
MSTDATTFPLRDTLLDDPADIAPRGTSPRKASASERAGAQTRTRRETAIGVGVLIWIGLCVLLIVLAAADRPSFLSSPSHYGFFPHWLAGPLGGMWPWFTRSSRATKSLLTAALVSMYVAYVVGLRYVPLLRARWAIATIVGVHAILLLSPPLSLTDVFNYINYGRMGMLHGLDPYTTIPALGPHNDPSYSLSNWHQLLTPYGPLFTLITYAVVPLGLAGSLWAFKGLLMVLSLATILLVWRCARLLGRDPVAAIVLVGLNPLILVWGLGGDHNDFFMMFCIVLAFYLLLRARAPGISPGVGTPREAIPARLRAWLWPLAAAELGAGVTLAAAIALKASAAILVPVILAGLLRTPRRLVQVALGLIAGGIVLGVCSVVAFGMHLPDLGAQGRLAIPMGLPNLLGLALGQGGETETMRSLLSVVLVLVVVGCSLLAWRQRDALTASGWATMALLLTLSWVLPWYVLWVLPLAALSRSRALRTTVLVFGAYLLLTWMPLATGLDNALGIRPTTTLLGQQHQRYVRGLLN